jgi:hypothetical protein
VAIRILVIEDEANIAELARRIAASSAGTLDVESGNGPGCLFVLRLPESAARIQRDENV